MDDATRTTGRLSPDDWARAALEAIAEGGVPSVAVERLASSLGATKGSFYWHFASRRAVIEAALSLWEREHTDAVITMMEAEADPATRLRRLMTTIIAAAARDRVELPLLANSDDPVVRDVVGRVTARRVEWVAQTYQQLGLDPGAARDRAVVAYATYVGHLQLVRATDQVPTTGPAARVHLDAIMQVLLAPVPDDHG
ncbi:MAG TPA: helix-turn-helix domain-containing protein [Nitriliruptoraceae bacterium]|nr:helix-turn-helix domain-containing protein [Nitriliruptoraceae bacterium]